MSLTAGTGSTGTEPSRAEQIEMLYRRHTRGRGTRSLRFLRKKYAWRLAIGGAAAVKRLIDIVVSAVALLLLAPLVVVIALLIKATDRGPVLFWQSRVGRWGGEFPFPKFRSMVTNAEALKDKLLAQNDHAVAAATTASGDSIAEADGAQSITFKMKRDPRVTWIGRILRKFSLDELPQLWCVLRGDMSLVGPRPPVPREVAKYTLRDRRRLDVKPGLTCIWQVSGRGDIPFPEQVALDVQYIESQSLMLDLRLLVATIPAVLFGRGAY